MFAHEFKCNNLFQAVDSHKLCVTQGWSEAIFFFDVYFVPEKNENIAQQGEIALHLNCKLQFGPKRFTRLSL